MPLTSLPPADRKAHATGQPLTVVLPHETNIAATPTQAPFLRSTHAPSRHQLCETSGVWRAPLTRVDQPTCTPWSGHIRTHRGPPRRVDSRFRWAADTEAYCRPVVATEHVHGIPHRAAHWHAVTVSDQPCMRHSISRTCAPGPEPRADTYSTLPTAARPRSTGLPP